MIEPSSGQATLGQPVDTSAGFWQVLLDCFFRPAERFSRFRYRPQWVAPLLVLSLLSVFITVLHRYVVPYANQVQAQIDQTEKITGPLSSEEKEARVSRRPGVTAQVGWLGLIVVFTGLSTLVCALAFWIAMMISGEDMGFATLFSLTTHSMVPPSVVWTLCATALLFLKDANDIDPVRLDNLVFSNPGAAFNWEISHPFLQSILGSIDVFSIWTMALMAIGISACARNKPLRKSAAITAAVWGLYILAKGLLAVWIPAIA